MALSGWNNPLIYVIILSILPGSEVIEALAIGEVSRPTAVKEQHSDALNYLESRLVSSTHDNDDHRVKTPQTLADSVPDHVLLIYPLHTNSTPHRDQGLVSDFQEHPVNVQTKNGLKSFREVPANVHRQSSVHYLHFRNHRERISRTKRSQRTSQSNHNVSSIDSNNTATNKTSLTGAAATKQQRNTSSAEEKVNPNTTTMSPSSSSTLYYRHRDRSKDDTWAFVSMSILLTLLFVLVLYSRMWKKRYTWDPETLAIQDFQDNTAAFRFTLPFTIKDLVSSKVRDLVSKTSEFTGRTSKQRRQQRNGGHYTSLPVNDFNSSEEEEEEVYVR